MLLHAEQFAVTIISHQSNVVVWLDVAILVIPQFFNSVIPKITCLTLYIFLHINLIQC